MFLKKKAVIAGFVCTIACEVLDICMASCYNILDDYKRSGGTELRFTCELTKDDSRPSFNRPIKGGFSVLTSESLLCIIINELDISSAD